MTNNNQWSIEETILAGMRMTVSLGAFKDKKRFSLKNSSAIKAQSRNIINKKKKRKKKKKNKKKF